MNQTLWRNLLKSLQPILIDVDSESECGYQGSVNRYLTDDNVMNSHGEDSYPGHEILSEFDEGDVEEMEKCAT